MTMLQVPQEIADAFAHFATRGLSGEIVIRFHEGQAMKIEERLITSINGRTQLTQAGERP